MVYIYSMTEGYGPFIFCDISRVYTRYVKLPVESQAAFEISPLIFKFGCKPETITELTRCLYNTKNSRRHNSKLIYLNIIK